MVSPDIATCTTLDIGSWWYLKSRPIYWIVKGYFDGMAGSWEEVPEWETGNWRLGAGAAAGIAVRMPLKQAKRHFRQV